MGSSWLRGRGPPPDVVRTAASFNSNSGLAQPVVLADADALAMKQEVASLRSAGWPGLPSLGPALSSLMESAAFVAVPDAPAVTCNGARSAKESWTPSPVTRALAWWVASERCATTISVMQSAVGLTKPTSEGASGPAAPTELRNPPSLVAARPKERKTDDIL